MHTQPTQQAQHCANITALMVEAAHGAATRFSSYINVLLEDKCDNGYIRMYNAVMHALLLPANTADRIACTVTAAQIGTKMRKHFGYSEHVEMLARNIVNVEIHRFAAKCRQTLGINETGA